MSTTPPDLDWVERGACRGMSPGTFYSDGVRGGTQVDRRLITQVCGACPVKVQCRDYALHHEIYGFWADTSPDERRRERHALHIKVEVPGEDDFAPCGTEGGYKRHLRRRESTCEDCRAAHTHIVAASRARKMARE